MLRCTQYQYVYKFVNEVHYSSNGNEWDHSWLNDWHIPIWLLDIFKPEKSLQEFLMSRFFTHHMPSAKTFQVVPNLYEESLYKINTKTGEITLAPKRIFREWHFPRFCENRNLGLHFHKTMHCHVASHPILSHVQYLYKRKLWLLDGGNRFVTSYIRFENSS